ncbi:MAG: hypothetical protein II949_00565 [Prevotella sp.]|nr:hypothetical protein [Prevotella sp.]
MKIFMVHEDLRKAGNPYIITLINGLQKAHPDCEIASGRDAFWSDDIFTFDVVHFHWAQAFMYGDPHTDAELLHHIEKLKAAGVKVVTTCHDLEPHYNQCASGAEAMKIVYSQCDAFFHLGDYSKQLFEQRYPAATHFLLPHHLYDTEYRSFPSREASLEHLGLPADRTYILCFGTFRSDEERQLVINLYRQLNNPKVSILAPGFIDVNLKRPNAILQLCKKIYYRYAYNIYSKRKSWGAVAEEDVPYYYGAADVCFIQRVKILNSGNALMPMLFGKVVVGPDCGNVGPLLKEWGYPVFPVDDLNHLGDIVRKAIDMGEAGFGTLHRQEQINRYATAVITNKLYAYYTALLTPNSSLLPPNSSLLTPPS